MKAKFTLVLLFVAAFLGSQAQQVPNGGFNSWGTYAPTGWTTYEAIFGAPLGLATKDSVDKAEGTASLKLRSDSVVVAPQYGVISGGVGVGGAVAGAAPGFTGIAFLSVLIHCSLIINYSAGAGVDSGALVLFLKKNGAYVLAGAITLGPLNQWAQIYIPMGPAYQNANVPDTLKMEFYSSADTAHQGSTLHVDDVRFGYVNPPSLVEEIDNNVSVSVFPNPATDVVNLTTSETFVNASVMVFDITGRVITHEFVNGNGHQLNTSEWAAGNYTFSLIDNRGKVVNKGRFSVNH